MKLSSVSFNDCKRSHVLAKIDRNMLAKVITFYLAALFLYGVFATLMPMRKPVKETVRTQQAVLHFTPFQDNAKAHIDYAILRDHLAAPEDRNADGLESDVRDQMKYRPLSSPMT